MSKKNIIMWCVAALVIVIAIAALVYRRYYSAPSAIDSVEHAGSALDDLSRQASQGVLPSIDPGSNPMKDAPDVNPVSKTNPFSNIKINPFK